MDEQAPTSGPLSGVRVVERAEGVAGSYAGRLFGLMGATVIKVEPPGRGCALRHEGPFLSPDPPVSALFEYYNAGKMGATCNLSNPLGRGLMEELLAGADVLLDDTPAAERPAKGLAPERLCARHKDLVFVSILPFGAFGPHRDYRAHELNAFHSGGEGYLMPNSLAQEMFPERPPIKAYGYFASLQAGTMAACGGIAALLARHEAGGQLVDVSIQDANVALSAFTVQRYGDGVLETRATRSFKYGGVVECADGYVEVLTIEDHQWRALVKLMGDPDWAFAPGMEDPLQRGMRGKEINAHLRAWAKGRSVEDFVRRGQALGVPVAKYYSPTEVVASDHVRTRGILEPVELDGRGVFDMFVSPYRFSEQPLRLGRGAPSLGSDNEEIWKEKLGHSPQELDRFRAAGVI